MTTPIAAIATKVFNPGVLHHHGARFWNTPYRIKPIAMMCSASRVPQNTATAVLIAPLALAIGQNLGIQPHALLMSVAVAASMAFASPVASPVNTLVMGAGNYRFSDYIKVGAPLMLIAMAVTMVVLPLLFPF